MLIFAFHCLSRVSSFMLASSCIFTKWKLQDKILSETLYSFSCVYNRNKYFQAPWTAPKSKSRWNNSPTTPHFLVLTWCAVFVTFFNFEELNIEVCLQFRTSQCFFSRICLTWGRVCEERKYLYPKIKQISYIDWTI